MSDGRSFPRVSRAAKRRASESPAPPDPERRTAGKGCATQSVRRAGRRMGLALAVALLGAATAAQNSPPGTPWLRALRISETIKIDGRLDEPAWARAEVAADFRQEEPREGEPATEKTEIRVLFDDRNLYIGIRAFDSDAARIQARDLTRDSDLSNDDKVEILIDTYHDRRNAYRFAVNPFGTQQDALITDEGRDVNRSWEIGRAHV